MTRDLEISASLSLPLRAVTEKLAWLGRTGSGKTYGAQKLAEEMHAAAAQFIVLDPVGVWYGLRLAADGKAPGLPVPVLGGLHGDIPLEAGAGAMIADLVVDRGVSVVLDVSQFESDADKARFATAFADRFFFRKKARPSAVHLFLEECQEFVPQNPQREDARMLHAFTRLVKIGRNFGIGISLISQRPQEVNKKVLNLTELLFAFQLTGPQERKTLQGWIAEKGIDEDIAGELPKLKVGAPHAWSPAWLEISGVVPIARKRTYDASSTPAVGAKAADARELSPIDLEQLRRDMAATIEKAKAEDPKELRRTIATLEAELKASRKHAAALHVTQQQKRVEVHVITRGQLDRLEYLAGQVDKGIERLESWRAADQARAEDLRIAATEIATAVRSARLAGLPPDVKTSSPVPTMTTSQALAVAARLPRGLYTASSAPSRANEKSARTRADALPKAQHAVLRAIVLRAVAGRPTTAVQAALLSGYSRKSSSFDNALGALRSAGLIEGSGQALQPTPEGANVISDELEALPTGAELARMWLGHHALGKAERALLQALLEHPAGLDKLSLAARSGYSATSSSFDNALGRLRSLELVSTVSPGVNAAHADFFA